MTAIIIVSAVILFFVFLLASFIKIEIEYDETLFVKIKYLLFTFFRMPKTERQKRKEKRKKEKQKKKEEKLRRKNAKGQHIKNKGSEKPSEKKTDTSKSDEKKSDSKNEDKDKNEKKEDVKNSKSEKEKKEKKPKPDMAIIVGCIKAAKPYVKRLFKKIRFDDVFLEITVGGDDAAKAAVSYGVHCSAVYGLVEFLKDTVHFNAKQIKIGVDFDMEKSDYYAYCNIKLRLSTLLFCAIWGFFAVLKVMKNTRQNDPPKENKKPKETPKKAA